MEEYASPKGKVASSSLAGCIMVLQLIATMLWAFVLAMVMIRCAHRRTTFWTMVFFVMIALPASDTNLFPESADPYEEYMEMTKDLPYQLGEWRPDERFECCYT